MGCQKEISKKIIEKKADYVLALKGNQGNLHEQIETFFSSTYEKNFLESKKWPSLKSIIMVKTNRKIGAQETSNTRFYISSCESNANKLFQAVRKHWQVANGLHWTLDVTFREDESRIRKGAASENFAIFRHIALNLIKQNKSSDASVKRKRYMAALDDNFRKTLMESII